ncbi:MAG TPA: YceI family protein [Rhizomicrobium sp.]|jgi:polyisoprenoid-binding protein YceI
MTRIALALLVVVAAISPAEAAHWNVDSAKSKLGFTVIWNKQPFTGVFKSWKADIDFDPADLGHAHVVATIDTGSETSDDSDTDDGIHGGAGFAASQFPTATFRTTAITHKSGNEYVAAGTLTIKGISRPVTLPFTLTFAGATAHMLGRAQVTRTEFKVGTGEWAKPDPVALDVTVNVDLTATKSGT